MLTGHLRTEMYCVLGTDVPSVYVRSQDILQINHFIDWLHLWGNLMASPRMHVLPDIWLVPHTGSAPKRLFSLCGAFFRTW
jgi:hypothetical protein